MCLATTVFLCAWLLQPFYAPGYYYSVSARSLSLVIALTTASFLTDYVEVII
jgi:hypothetical protein